MQFSVDHHDGVVVAAGEIDVAASRALAEALAAARSGRDALAVEMDQVTFLDSRGLRELLRPALDGVSVTLRRPSGPVVRLLHVAGVEDQFVVES